MVKKEHIHNSLRYLYEIEILAILSLKMRYFMPFELGTP